MHFSDTFKRLCKEKGVTQKRALEEMGLGRNAVQKWTTGNPSYEVIKKIAVYFDVSVDALIDDRPGTITATDSSIVLHGNHVNSSVNKSATEPVQLSEMEKELLRIFRKMDMRKKNATMSHFYEIEDQMREV